MEASKYLKFVKDTLAVTATLNGGERKRLREKLKYQDTYIRHVQRFNQKGDINGILCDGPGDSGGVLQSLPDEGSNNGAGTTPSDAGVDSGEKANLSGADQPHEGTICPDFSEERGKCPCGEGQGTETKVESGL